MVPVIIWLLYDVEFFFVLYRFAGYCRDCRTVWLQWLWTDWSHSTWLAVGQRSSWGCCLGCLQGPVISSFIVCCQLEDAFVL